VTALRIVQFLAILLTALALVPAGAHLFALPGKVDMTQAQYFTVQDIYRGWSIFGFVLIGALAADLALMIGMWRDRGPLRLAATAFCLMASTLAIFFIWTWPANQATRNWTVPTPDWEQLRVQWEFAHAGNAILTFIALCCVILAVLRAGEGSGRRRIFG
jgi:hypothetical protein